MTNRPTLPRVTHVGDAPDMSGGIASVLRTYSEMGLPARAVASYRRGGRAPNWLPFPAAAATLAARSAETLGVVHVHVSRRACYLREGALVRLAAARGLPVVATVHGGNFVEYLQRRPRLVRWALEPALRLGVLTAEAVAAVSGLSRFPPAVVLPNPVLVPLTWTPPSSSARTVLFAGKVCRAKGVDVLLTAWVEVLGSVPDANLVIAGPTADIEPRPLPNVTWVGAVGPEKIGDLLSQARTAVLPSRSESMPMFVLEAMARARPVVATAVGAIPSMTGASGLIVTPGDPTELAQALVKVLVDDPLADSMGERARTLVEQRHGPVAVTAALGDFYAAALASR